MLNLLNYCAKGRSSWFLAGFIALVLLIVALYMQHVMMLKPCVLCICERCALLGIVVSGFFGSATRCIWARFLALLIWFYSAWQGFAFAYEHTMFELNTNPFAVCRVAEGFPAWLPLDKWLPDVFLATGPCDKGSWSFLTLSMPRWLMIIFALYFLSAILMLIGLLRKPKEREIFKC